MAVINHRFKLCTFDVTNTLLKFQSSVGEQYAEIGKIYGVERDPNQISKSFRHHWKIMNTNHPNYGKNTGLSSHEWWKEIVRQTFIVESNELTTNQLNSISGHLYNLYKSDIYCVLKSNGLKPYFDFILASYLVRAAKPSREIFDLALNQSDSIDSSQAVHIGDNVKLDYFAAKHAGWNALLLTKSNIDNQCLDQVDPSEIVNNMEEIEKFVLSS
ncbi:rhythmically expressed gene 2 protein [Caerostris extrusa]|uniref:Rhythmically expressed gene 2 protein n=1 Tax=Caerostris extrusa TaxID=172846 RepID=A0AAV4VXC5_CAEEX|nr:rhythmically expressed gene 2 protein [Caerostris extrusa]